MEEKDFEEPPSKENLDQILNRILKSGRKQNVALKSNKDKLNKVILDKEK